MNKILLPVLALLLAGCAAPAPRCPMIANEGRYCLQPLSAIAPFSAQQKIELQFKARNETMLALIEVDSDALRFAALSPFGQKLMQVQCTDTHIEAPLWPDDRLDPALFCAMLQLSLWPDDSVRAGLQAPLQMESGAHTRRVDGPESTIFQLRYQGAQPPYRHIELDMNDPALHLNIETLQGPAAQ